MKLRNIEIEPFVEFLMSFELKGKESRLRTRLVKLLNEKLANFRDEHLELVKDYANLDENKNPVIIDKGDGTQAYDIENIDEFNYQYDLLMFEEFTIENTEERNEMLTFVKDMVLDCDKVFSGIEALRYDRFCDIVEQVE